MTVLRLVPRAFPLEGRRATFLGAFGQYLYTSLVRAESLHLHLYMNVVEPSYTLQKACTAFSNLLPLRQNVQQLFVFLFDDPL